MKLNPYLTFAGDCEEAFARYAAILGGTVGGTLRFGQAPDTDWVGADWRDKIMHSAVAFGDQVLMGSDAPPPMYRKPQGTSVALQVDSDAEAERIYAALKEGGTVSMELQETFWASRFAMLEDRFAIRWIINCEKPMG
jgi:PhnB protein